MAIEETITIDAGEAISALDELAAAAEEAAAKFAAAMDKLKVPAVGGAGADKLAASMDEAAAAIDASVSKIEAAFGRLAGVGDAAAAGLDALGEAADSAAGPLDAAAAAADEAAAAQDRLAESADIAGASLDRTSASADAAAASTDAAAAGAAAGAESHSKLGEYALGAAVIIGYATDKAMKFNAQMVTLNTQAGVSKKQLGALSEGVLELAGQVGQSPTSLAESLYHVESNMQSLGIKAPQALNMVKVAAEGASVGHANLVDVTNALTAAVASGIPGVKNYSQAMGVLNATVGAGDMTMQDLADAMGTGAVAAVKGYGLNIKDVGAALAVFGDNNIRGAKAGTDLRMSVQALAVPVSTAKAELSKLGLTTTTLATDMQSGGLLKALDDLQSRFKATGITAKNEGEVITELFGKKAGVGLSILMEQMGRLQSKYPDLTRGANDFGQAWATTQQTAQQKLKQLESGAQAMAITLGNIALPSADKIMGGLDKAMEFVQSHSFASKGLTLGLGTLIAGGLAKGIFSGVESSLEGIGKLGSLLKIPGMDKLAGIGQNTGLNASASALDGSASSLEGAAASLDGAAASIKGGAATGGVTGGARAGEGEAAGAGAAAAGAGEGAAAAEGAAGATGLARILGSGGLMAGIRAAAGPMALGLTIGEVAKAVGDKLAPAGTTAGTYNAALQRQQYQGGPASQLNSGVFGGFEGKLMAEIGLPVGKAISAIFDQKAPPLNLPASAAGVASRYGAPGGTAGLPPVAANVPASTFATAPAASTLIPGGHTGAETTITAKVAVDTSALASAKATIQQDLLGAGGHPAPIKLPAPDTSAIDAAKSKVQSDIAGLGGHPAPVKLPPPDLSALVAAKGAAAADGAAVGAGFAAGIAGEAGAAAAAGASLAAAAEAAMKVSLKISSPSKVAEKIGQDFTAGFSQGIIGGEDSAKAASAEIGSASVASLLQGLVGGQSNVQNAIQAVMGAASNPDAVTSVQQTIQTLIGDVPAKDTGLVKWLGQQQNKLSALANKQGALMAEINDAQQIATQQISNASILNAGAYVPAIGAAGGPQSSVSTITGLQQMAADQKQFASQLAQLGKEGLNATSLSQLAQGGASAGLPVTQGLITGGKGAVQQINALEKQIIASSQSIGNTGGPAMYTSGQQVMTGLASGLKAELKQVDKVMTAEANAVIAKVQKTLGTKAATTSSTSSSSAAAGSTSAASAAAATVSAAGFSKASAAAGAAATGLDRAGTAGGMAATGLTSVATAAASAAAGLGKIVSVLAPLSVASAQPLGGGGYSAHPGGGVASAQPITVHVHLDGQQIATSTTNVMIQNASQNWQSSPVPLPSGRR